MSLPHIDEIYKLIAESKTPLTKRDMVDSLKIKGDDRRILKQYLQILEEDGRIVKGEKQAYSVPNALPEVTMIRITGTDIDGDLFAEPLDWDESSQGAKPRIELVCNTPLREGDKALARLQKFTDTLYEGSVIRRVENFRTTVLGEVVKTGKGYVLRPVDKKAKYEFDIPQTELGGAKSGDLAVGEIKNSRGLKNKQVGIIDVIGHKDDVKAISLIALHEAGLREEFPDKVLSEATDLKVPPLDQREDLRHLPLVTIDGADARDFDDAVFAERAEDGGFHIIVAIADVAHYVRPGSALDKEALRRGNSTYFPDRVVPMLPEALSNDMCSLNPAVDRACMGFHLWIDTNGQLIKQKVFRGLMHSKARLTYEQVQAAKDGITDEITRYLVDDVITPLYEAYAILDTARQKRGALDLDLPERQILINEKGKMIGVKKRLRLNSHKLIEEFMILANVAAAQGLEKKNAPCVYRIHDRPSADKLEDARGFLESFGLNLPTGGIAKPAQINHILQQAKETNYSPLISQVILRTQSQAVYHPENIGHFGLALQKYAHFTSPIRRYADLLVHRSLIKAYGLGGGGMSEEEEVTLTEKAEHISTTERTSAEAERSAIDRFTASWMSERIGAEFSGIISSVTRFGLFVTLDENGADGLIPMRSLPDDFYIHDEKQHALIGRRHRRIYRLGAPVTVRLREADGLTGSSLFEMANDLSADIAGITFKQPFLGKERDRKRSKKTYQNKKKSGRDGSSSDGFKKSGNKKSKGSNPPRKGR